LARAEQSAKSGWSISVSLESDIPSLRRASGLTPPTARSSSRYRNPSPPPIPLALARTTRFVEVIIMTCRALRFSCALLRLEASIHVQDMAGDEARLIRQQPADRVRHL